MRKRVAVLISGRGSNMRALVEAARAADYPAEIVLVLSNRPGVAGLDYARAAGIATATVDHKGFADRQAFDQALDAALHAAEIDLLCLAGFMRLLTPWFVERWRDRAINIHPSLLPAFPGLDTHRRALAAGVRLSGASVHYLRAGTDEGPCLVQAAVPVLPDDTEDTLAARILQAEHRIYPLALRILAGGPRGRPAEGALLNPVE